MKDMKDQTLEENLKELDKEFNICCKEKYIGAMANVNMNPSDLAKASRDIQPYLPVEFLLGKFGCTTDRFGQIPKRVIFSKVYNNIELTIHKFIMNGKKGLMVLWTDDSCGNYTQVTDLLLFQ